MSCFWVFIRVAVFTKIDIFLNLTLSCYAIDLIRSPLLSRDRDQIIYSAEAARSDFPAMEITLLSGQAVKNSAWIWEKGKKWNKIIWKKGSDLSDCFFLTLMRLMPNKLCWIFFSNYVKKYVVVGNFFISITPNFLLAYQSINHELLK